jgi:hypothetical protein
VERTPDAPRDGALFHPTFAQCSGGRRLALTNGETRLTELNLFKATNIAHGPLATVKLPLRLRPAYHGSWAESARVIPARLNGEG